MQSQSLEQFAKFLKLLGAITAFLLCIVSIIKLG